MAVYTQFTTPLKAVDLEYCYSNSASSSDTPAGDRHYQPLSSQEGRPRRSRSLESFEATLDPPTLQSLRERYPTDTSSGLMSKRRRDKLPLILDQTLQTDVAPVSRLSPESIEDYEKASLLMKSDQTIGLINAFTKGISSSPVTDYGWILQAYWCLLELYDGLRAQRAMAASVGPSTKHTTPKSLEQPNRSSSPSFEKLEQDILGAISRLECYAGSMTFGMQPLVSMKLSRKFLVASQNKF